MFFKLLVRSLLSIVLCSSTILAHNNRVAVAVSLEDIEVDGAFGDWPDVLSWNRVTHREYGLPSRDEEDFSGRFAVGYSVRENALYLAVEIVDESTLVDPAMEPIWDAQDGCEVYLDVEHWKGRHAPVQFALHGEVQKGPPAEVAVQREGKVRRYEWRIETDPLQLAPGIALGCDVAVLDKDADGSFTWISWGRGGDKYFEAAKLGDLLLLEVGQGAGQMQGRVSWQDGGGVAGGQVRLQSLDRATLKAAVVADREGYFTAALPAGSWRLEWRPRRGTWKEQQVEIETGGELAVDLEVRPVALGLKSEVGRKEIGQRRFRRGAREIGQHRFRQGEWEIMGVTAPYPRVPVQNIYQDRQGNMWFGTYQGGMSFFDGEQFEEVWDQGSNVLQDRAGNMWFGGGGYKFGRSRSVLIYRYDGRQFTVFGPEDSPLGAVSMLEDRAGHLWFANPGQGVIRYDGRQFSTFTVDDGLVHVGVVSILEDRAGHLWFGGGWGYRGKGIGTLCRYDGEHFTAFATDAGLPDHPIADMLEDRSGRLWIATHGGGVSRYDGESFVNFTTADGLAHDRVWSIAEDDDGHLWMGTEAGLSHYDGKKFR